MPVDNPPPEMIQARNDVLARLGTAHKDAADAWQKIREAYDAIGASTAPFGGSEREKLYQELSAAQDVFKSSYGKYEEAHEAARKYFQPLASGASDI